MLCFSVSQHVYTAGPWSQLLYLKTEGPLAYKQYHIAINFLFFLNPEDDI